MFSDVLMLFLSNGWRWSWVWQHRIQQNSTGRATSQTISGTYLNIVRYPNISCSKTGCCNPCQHNSQNQLQRATFQALSWISTLVLNRFCQGLFLPGNFLWITEPLVTVNVIYPSWSPTLLVASMGTSPNVRIFVHVSSVFRYLLLFLSICISAIWRHIV